MGFSRLRRSVSEYLLNRFGEFLRVAQEVGECAAEEEDGEEEKAGGAGVGLDAEGFHAAADGGGEAAPAFEVLPAAAADERNVAHEREFIEMKLHAELREEQAISSPTGFGIERHDRFNEDGAKLFGARVVNDKPRTGCEHGEQHPEPVETDEDRPDEIAELRGGGLGAK